jgi:hypothetical protein
MFFQFVPTILVCVSFFCYRLIFLWCYLKSIQTPNVLKASTHWRPVTANTTVLTLAASQQPVSRTQMQRPGQHRGVAVIFHGFIITFCMLPELLVFSQGCCLSSCSFCFMLIDNLKKKILVILTYLFIFRNEGWFQCEKTLHGFPL